MLYNFSELDKKLDEWGFPRLDGKSGFKIIKGIDFEKAYKAGSISFEDDGIYLLYEGKKYEGYMFIKEPYISQYGTYPKFHLTKCQTIQQFISDGKFKVRYDWSNSNVNDLIDKTTGEVYADVVLELCSYCRKKIIDDIEDTEDFHQTIDTTDFEDKKVEIDVFGYTKDWNKISRQYRSWVDNTCEHCGIEVRNGYDKKFLHVHHIDGDKINNNYSNLECLCILCHSFVDETHENNFKNRRMSMELRMFVKKYREELMFIENHNLEKYDKER